MIFKERYEQQKGRPLGKGKFGQIFKVKDKKDGKLYALKYIIPDTEENINKLKDNYKEEIQLMKHIKSKYIVKLIDNFYDETYEGYCIVMELCDGNLRNILNKYKPKGLPLELINKIFIQLNDALKAMLETDYIHRDIKPENILIKYTDKNEKNFDIKLTDFGLSAVISSSIREHSQAGTLKYWAPEIDLFQYNKQCDLWSLGVLLYELYTNSYIFDFGNPEDIENNRKNGIIKKTDNKLINNLIKQLIEVDIKKRIKWEEYFNDDFFKQNNNNKNYDFSVDPFQEIISFLNRVSMDSIFDSNSKLDGKYFDSKGNNKPFNYQKKGIRGGKEYYGPNGWTGYGLSVNGKYDNGDNTWLGMTGKNPGEWCVAYHGTSIKFAKSIIINGLQAGPRQFHSNDNDINHPGKKVGIGVVVTPDILLAEQYSEEFQGYKCVFMCRVNPLNVRIPDRNPRTWIVNGNSNDIRPYRLLIKKV